MFFPYRITDKVPHPHKTAGKIIALGGFLRVKRPGREADHSPPSSAEVKEYVELYVHSPISLRGVVLS
jgi:hypothetical protein